MLVKIVFPTCHTIVQNNLPWIVLLWDIFALLGKSFDQLSKEEQKAYNRLQTDINFLLRGTSLEDYLLSAKTKMGNLFDESEERKFYNRIKGQLGQDQLAEGGRVGFQEGTPNPTLPQPKPKEPMDDRKVENLMKLGLDITVKSLPRQ